MDQNKKLTKIFFLIGVAFVTCLLISNIIAGKLISVFGLTLTAGVILFPVTYIFGDIITEVYGFKQSRLIIWSGFACNVFMAAIFLIVIALPTPGFWTGQNAYATVLGTTPRVVIASLLAYFLGEFSNSVILSKLKIVTNGRWLWMRTIGSTIVGEGIDTLIFITGVFWGTVPGNILVQMIVLQYIWKVTYEVVLTPVTYTLVRWFKNKEGIDVFDKNIKYNPFSLKVD